MTAGPDVRLTDTRRIRRRQSLHLILRRYRRTQMEKICKVQTI